MHQVPKKNLSQSLELLKLPFPDVCCILRASFHVRLDKFLIKWSHCVLFTTTTVNIKRNHYCLKRATCYSQSRTRLNDVGC